MTVKQWKAFQEYRAKKFKEVCLSKSYQDLEERIKEEDMKMFDNLGHMEKRKFLWWEYEAWVSLDPLQVPFNIGYRELLKSYKRNLFLIIPDNTVEACLTWLSNKQK